MSFFSRFRRIVIERIYSNKIIVLYQRKQLIRVNSAAEIRRVTKANVSDASVFQTPSQLRLFNFFLEKGNIGYYAYLNGSCVHRSWIVQGPGVVKLHKFLAFDLSKNEYFIQYCETAPIARGKNIFTHVLSHISHAFAIGTLLTVTEKQNTASRRSMEKAGFRVREYIRIRVIFGRIRVYRNQNL